MATSTPDSAPQPFGRYILLDRMGVGGMAEVFRAVAAGAEGFQRTVVIKRILATHADAPEFVDMFIEEARISALLHHPNIVQVFDFGHVDGSYFLAMEMLRGRDFGAVLRKVREQKRQLPIPVAAYIGREVALGLAYAHGLSDGDGRPLNITHRDVSPSNIMCLRTGGVKLLDFGIARAMGAQESSGGRRGGAHRSMVKGKTSYMAPETLRRQAQDARVDLFALGAVLWEALTGRRLFYGKDHVEKVRQVLQAPVPPPSSLRPEIPRALDAIVLKALERDPARRYESAAAMADDLERVAQDVRYQSRMLPTLLEELFGGKETTSRIALAMVTPELLSAVSASGTMTPLPRRRGRLKPLITGAALGLAVFGVAAGLMARAALRRGIAPAAASTLAATATANNAQISPSSPGAPASALTRVGAPIVMPLTAGPATQRTHVTSSGVDQSHGSEAPSAGDASAASPVAWPATTPGRASASAASKVVAQGSPPRKHAAASSRWRKENPKTSVQRRQRDTAATAERVVRGLPIDPFAEAATRSGRDTR